MTFQEESIESMWEEALPLFQQHYDSTAFYKDIPLEPDFDKYKYLCELGFIKLYTSRDASTKELIGYSIYFVQSNVHHKSSMQALQDVIFIKPDRRGFGHTFIKWCDEQLKSLGCQAVYTSVKDSCNFGPLLKRQGYEKVEVVYSKRLDV